MAAKLMVEGLPPSFSTQHLKDLFASFGTVFSARVITDSAGQSLRIGEVEMSTPQEAQNAIAGLNRSYVEGAVLLVFEQGETGRSNGPGKNRAP